MIIKGRSQRVSKIRGVLSLSLKIDGDIALLSFISGIDIRHKTNPILVVSGNLRGRRTKKSILNRARVNEIIQAATERRLWVPKTQVLY